MRVSELTKHNTVQQNLNQNAQELQNIQTSMSNGKVLNKPSDDPIGAAKVQEYRTSINHAKNIEKNIGSGIILNNAKILKPADSWFKHLLSKHFYLNI